MAGLTTPAPQTRRRLGGSQVSDKLSLFGSLGAAVASTALLFGVLTSMHGAIAFVVVAYLSFLAYYAVLVSLDETLSVVKDRVASVLVATMAVILFGALMFVLVFPLKRGYEALGHLNFLTEDLSNAGPLDGLERGGILHAVVGTLQMIAIALAITIPLGLLCAVYLNEFPSRFARFVRTIVEAMTALPSIVAGLFIYASVVTALGAGKSGFAAGLAISVMMLPIIIRAADVVIRLVPASLREASYALGTSHFKTVWHVVLPTSRSGLTTAVILGTARGIGETSPVLLTAGYTAAMNANPSEGPMVSLPLVILSLVQYPSDAMVTRGFGAAIVLLALVLFLFVLARALGGRAPGHESARQRKKTVAASRKDVQRFATRVGALVIVLGAVGASLVSTAKPAYAESYVPISGAGSTWSQNALDQWRRNVTQYGMQINYAGTGSSDGRNQFRNNNVDFAVSEIPYGLSDGGVVDTPPARKFAYMPIVAGGTAFMYNLKIAGARVTNLRLSGETVAKIFTGNITMWNDPAIAADNPLLALPARKIVPVVRSDGSGTTAQLTTWLSKRYQGLWDPYCAKAGRNTSPCGVTSFFPVASGSGYTAQSGSLGVSGFVSQEQNEGTITYVEYSYALNTNFPVVKLLNKSGYYVEPTASNVAVALTEAQINNDASSQAYLTQILDGVYDNGDKRAYPLSSYSYMVVPTAADSKFTNDKGYTLGAFAYYFLCEGQQQAPELGYSPLPINLVKAGIEQVKAIPGVDVQSIDLSKCNNPTFSPSGENLLAKNAPMPPECDKVGTTQCVEGTGGDKKPTKPTKPGATAPASPTSSATPGATPATGGDPSAPAAPGAADPGTTVVDPDTGQVLAGGEVVTAGSQPVAATTVNLAAGQGKGTSALLMGLAGFFLLGVVLLPPLLSRLWERKNA